MWALKVLQAHYSTIATQCTANNNTKPGYTPAPETTSAAARSLRKRGSAPSVGCNRFGSKGNRIKQTQRNYWHQPSSQLPVMQTNYLQHLCESPSLYQLFFISDVFSTPRCTPDTSSLQLLQRSKTSVLLTASLRQASGSCSKSKKHPKEFATPGQTYSYCTEVLSSMLVPSHVVIFAKPPSCHNSEPSHFPPFFDNALSLSDHCTENEQNTQNLRYFM